MLCPLSAIVLRFSNIQQSNSTAFLPLSKCIPEVKNSHIYDRIYDYTNPTPPPKVSTDWYQNISFEAFFSLPCSSQ